MTEAKYVVAIIGRDIAEKIPVTVLLHEMPVLQLVHANAEVRPADIDPLIESCEVELEEEYERLVNQYGMDESGVPFVERVYGRLDEFVKKVEEGYETHQPKKAKGNKVTKPEDAGDESNAG